jgi:hypothetical protein
VVGSGGIILKTTNGGTTWTTQNSGTTTYLNSVYFTSPTDGYAVGGANTILKTTNGGTTWTTQTSGTLGYLNSVYFISSTTGYAVGGAGIILKTTNGGTTWTTQTSSADFHLNAVHFPSSTTGYAVGNAGSIMVYSATTPLPVSVVALSAKAAGSTNHLSWHTGADASSTSFSVERSATGIGFAPIGTVQGNKGSDYAYIDETVTGTAYYRLRIEDESGESSYSPVSLIRRSAGSAVIVAPQPVQGTFTIRSTDAALDGTTATVLDVQGQEVTRFVISSIVQVDAGSWVPGFYTLRLANGETLRLIKQ